MTLDGTASWNQDDVGLVDQLRSAAQKLREQVGQVVVGQADVVDELLIALFCRGHCILEGVPGLAKTLLVSTLAQCLSLSFSRIQFTPDLMPADITGSDVIVENKSTGDREIRFLEGPIFAQVILADEINRTPPKTQAALLEAMQEGHVTIGRARHRLIDPFFVLATQNPIEQEGTYPLPEAQQDRFLFKILVRYPTWDEELEVARRTTSRAASAVDPVLAASDILALQDVVRRTPMADAVAKYALALVRQTRVGQPEVAPFLSDYLSWGAGPRAVQSLLLGAKAKALLDGQDCVRHEDVAALAKPVLRHRLVTNFAADADGVSTDALIDRLLQETPTREDELKRDRRFASLLGA